VDLSRVQKRYEDLSPSERFSKRKELLNKFKQNILNFSNSGSITPDPEFEKVLKTTFSHTAKN